MKEIIPKIALYLVMLVLAIMAIVGGYGLIKVGLNYFLEIETCHYRKVAEVCSTFDKERFVDSIAMLLVSKPSLLFLWLMRKKI